VGWTLAITENQSKETILSLLSTVWHEASLTAQPSYPFLQISFPENLCMFNSGSVRPNIILELLPAIIVESG
jgi:hypothetical protein